MEQSSASFGAWRKHILSPCMRVDTLYASKVRRGRHRSHAEIGHPDAKSNVARFQPLTEKIEHGETVDADSPQARMGHPCDKTSQVSCHGITGVMSRGTTNAWSRCSGEMHDEHVHPQVHG